jgi:GTP-binding protein
MARTNLWYPAGRIAPVSTDRKHAPEGFELGVSRPEVVTKMVDGELHEPFEVAVIDIEEQHQGPVMEEMGRRKAELKNMEIDGKGRVRLEYLSPSRGLIGFRNSFLTMTSGSGIMTSVFDHYGPAKPGAMAGRSNGVLVSMVTGKVLGYALFSLARARAPVPAAKRGSVRRPDRWIAFAGK